MTHDTSPHSFLWLFLLSPPLLHSSPLFLIDPENAHNGGVWGDGGCQTNKSPSAQSVHVTLCLISRLLKSLQTPEQIYSPLSDCSSRCSQPECVDWPASPALTNTHYFWVLLSVGKLLTKSSDITNLTIFLVAWQNSFQNKIAFPVVNFISNKKQCSL